ncbi:MAG: HAD hydrolase family protein [Bacteriovoracaceae bacterium]|nr:HAD hydrolase family protein [Bacteriovoracaceae bacterium]
MALMRDIRAAAVEHEEKLKKIKVFLCDVDGILTNGQIYWGGEEIGFNRFFHALDGYGLKLLKKGGIKVGIVTGGDSVGVKMRASNLTLDYSFVGNEDKREAFKQVIADGYDPSEILYIGDELFDIPLLKKAGFSATVENSSHEVRECVDYITERDGGQGCVREVVDLVRYAQNIKPQVLDFD